MVDELSRGFTPRLANRIEDAALGDAAEIAVDGRSPASLDHVEADSTRQHIGLVEPRADATSGDTALIVAVSRLIERVGRK